MVVTSLSSLIKRIRKTKPTKIVLVSSPAVLRHVPWAKKALVQALGKKIVIITVVDGEKAKQWNTLEKLLTYFGKLHLDRKSLVIALGGGSVGDLVGFASSLYLRGIAYVQIPTTLLAQVDSAIGGKVGINLRAYKNQLGSFYNPVAICIDKRFLSTLARAQIIDGLAEIIKMGLIKNPLILKQVDIIGTSAFSNPEILEKLIHRSIQAKQYFENKDPRDGGIRQLLNFGHTLGHAIEIKYHTSHGTAVLIGMLKELSLGIRLGQTPLSVYRDLQKRLGMLGIEVKEKKYKVDQKSILHDKKIKGNKISLPIITRPGKAKVKEIPLKMLLKMI